MAENTERPDDKSSDGTVPSQKRGFGTKRHAAPAPADAPPALEASLANLVDSVKVLQSHLAGGKALDETASETEPNPRRAKRFQRRTGTGDELSETEAEPVLDHDVRGTEATMNKNIAWPRLTRPEEAPVGLGERAATYIRRHPFILWVLVQVTGLGLLLLGFWAGQSISGDEEERPSPQESAAKAAATDVLARAGVSDRALLAVGIGLHAEKTGDTALARQTWEEAAAGRVGVPGAEYRLAMLDIENNDFSSADIRLTKSLAAGEMMASCYFVNACFAGKKSDYQEAAKQFARAVKVDPFSEKYLFCWGEALRRAGKTQAAIEALTQALDRPASPADLELIDFKRRLARVESGHDELFNAELAAALAKSPVGGDWLLLAAAQELGRAAYPAAAGHLKEAARVLSPHSFSLLVQDYLFQGYAGHPEIGPLLKTQPLEASGKPLDPGAWPLEEADPAVWPPFAAAL